RNLENKVVARTQELEAARDDAIKIVAENRRLIQQIHSAVEGERRNIAVEMHDHLNSELIVSRLAAQRILDLTESELSDEAIQEIRGRANVIMERSASLYEMARGIVRRLRPETIDTLGLKDAIEEMVQRFDAVNSNCRFDFWSSDEVSRMKGEVAITTYRLVQEAMSNIVKHAGATKASVRLRLEN